MRVTPIRKKSHGFSRISFAMSCLSVYLPFTETFGIEVMQIAYPLLFDICPMMLQTRSMILAKDGSNLLRWFQQEKCTSRRMYKHVQGLNSTKPHSKPTTVVVQNLPNIPHPSSRSCRISRDAFAKKFKIHRGFFDAAVQQHH